MSGEFDSVLRDPLQNRFVVLVQLATSSNASPSNFEKRQQMLVEPNGLIVVAIEQASAMKSGLIDQTRQMHVSAKFLVGTARVQSLHGEKLYEVAGKGRWVTAEKSLSGTVRMPGFCSSSNSPWVILARPITSWPENIPPFSN